MSDFEQWWNDANIKYYEENVDAAAEAWDHQQEKIDKLEAELAKVKQKLQNAEVALSWANEPYTY